MPTATTMSIYYELPKERKTTHSSLSLMKMGKKTIKTVKRKFNVIKKGLYKGKYSILLDSNYLFTNLMKIQSPHPELDPRISYNPIYFQPTHPQYHQSVFRMLSYALSSSLNNYHIFLKDQGFVGAKISQQLEEDKEQIAIENICLKPKKTNLIKQKKELSLQTKNEMKKVDQQPEKVQRAQESIQTQSTIAVNEDPESKPILQNIEINKSQKQIKQISKAEKKQDIQGNLDLALIEQPKLPKFGLEIKQRKLIRQNLLMRRAQDLPLKLRPSRLSREMRLLSY